MSTRGTGGRGRGTAGSGRPRRSSGTGKGRDATPAGGRGAARGEGGARSKSSRVAKARGGTGKRPPATSARRGGPDRRGAGPARSGNRRDAHGLGGDQVEGRQAVRELLLAGRRRVHEVLVESGMPSAPILEEIAELAAEARVPVREVSAGRLRSVARTESPQGVVAHAQAVAEADLDELLTAPSPFLVLFDGVTDPGNLGAALRSAEGAGVSGVILPRHRAVHLSPTVTKAAAGAIEHLPITLVGGLPSTVDRLRRAGVLVLGLDAGADQSLDRLAVGARPVALVLGAEGTGLSRLVRRRCDIVVSIPLEGAIASLNVAAAAAVACFELRRQRRSDVAPGA